MTLRCAYQKFGACFFCTTSFIDRRPYGQNPGVYEALADSLIFYIAKYEAKLPAYVFMPTHVHLLLVLDGKHLGNFMRDFKKYLAQKPLRQHNTKVPSLWERGYDRQTIYTEESFRTKLNYIHNNPVKSGLVVSAPEWPWSSAAVYMTEIAGPIPVWKEWFF